MRFAIDVSHYDYIKYDVVAPHLDLVVIKLDDRAIEHVNGFASRGVPIAYYHWFDPTETPSRQVVRSMEKIQNLGIRPQFLAIDLEQWWADWGKYYQFLRRVIPASAVPRVSNKTLASGFEAVYSLFEKYVDFPLVVYTRTSFVNDYMYPYFRPLIGKKLWLARYIINQVTRMTWDGAKQKASSLSLSALVVPPGSSISDVVGWQFSGDRVLLPGMYNSKYMLVQKAVDLNVFSNDVKVTVTFTGTRARVNATLGLNIREAPSLSARKIGSLRFGDIVLVQPETQTNGFVKLGDGSGWVYRKYLDYLF